MARLIRGDAPRAMTFARRAQALVESGHWRLETDTRSHLVVAEWVAGEVSKAERGLSSSIAAWRAAGPYPAAYGSYQLGDVQRAQGRLDAALRTYRESLEITTSAGRPVPSLAGIANVGMAQVAYQRNELDAALRYASEGIALCRQLSNTQPLATGLAVLGWIRQVGGDPTGALDAIQEAVRTALDPGVSNPVPSMRARLWLAQGDVNSAARWTKERELGADDEPTYARESDYLVLVRVLLAEDQLDQALALLERLRTAADAQGRMGSSIEIRALQALALSASGDEAGAMTAVTEALTLGWPQGYIRVFADEGTPMHSLLRRLVAAQRTDRTVAHGISLEYLGQLIRAFEQDAAHSAPAVARSVGLLAGLVEPLSQRELEVLRLLAAGKQNREIADELSVALDTVKKHITHILEKLGASNRTDATARARQLGLLP